MATNYQPISVCPIAKVFEKIIYSRLNSFFIRNNVICEEQFGLWRGHSTSLAIADIYSNILDNLDRKNYTCAVFLYLKKGFDIVNHDIVAKTLQNGIRGNASDLRKSYLTNRIQYTVVDNHVASNPHQIKTGIPQGSMLGPLPFIVYITDLP